MDPKTKNIVLVVAMAALLGVAGWITFGRSDSSQIKVDTTRKGPKKRIVSDRSKDKKAVSKKKVAQSSGEKKKAGKKKKMESREREKSKKKKMRSGRKKTKKKKVAPIAYHKVFDVGDPRRFA